MFPPMRAPQPPRDGDREDAGSADDGASVNGTDSVGHTEPFSGRHGSTQLVPVFSQPPPLPSRAAPATYEGVIAPWMAKHVQSASGVTTQSTAASPADAERGGSHTASSQPSGSGANGGSGNSHSSTAYSPQEAMAIAFRCARSCIKEAPEVVIAVCVRVRYPARRNSLPPSILETTPESIAREVCVCVCVCTPLHCQKQCAPCVCLMAPLSCAPPPQKQAFQFYAKKLRACQMDPTMDMDASQWWQGDNGLTTILRSGEYAGIYGRW